MLEIGANNPILRAKNSKITLIDQELKLFAKNLKKRMYEYDGVGLAAPQVGINKQIITVTKREKVKKKNIQRGELVMINPQVIFFSPQTDIEIEGCLSLPGIEGEVERSTLIKVTYTTLKNKTITESFEGFTARVIQHEIDHLNGILFIDKLVR